ncbi:MAG: AMP-binding protein [Patescibacteria group bacterium]|jgi:phenylacetate-coenzyme A ligase PaaK-like adenylate-forming protein
MEWHELSHLSREEIREIQNQKLQRLMRHEIGYSPFYRELFKKNNINPKNIKTTDDLVQIPFVSKADLAPTEDDRGRPRQFILQPDEHLIKKNASLPLLLKILAMKVTGHDPKPMLEKMYKPVHMHFTTGRTALPTPVVYTASDLELLKESGKRMLNVIHVPNSVVAINAFPYAPHLAFWLSYYSLVSVGMTSLQTGGGKISGTQKILDAIERLKGGLLLGIPGYIYHLLRTAVAQKRNFENLEYVVLGGERASPGMREKLKGLLRELGSKNPKIYVTYAFTEGKSAWIQCHESEGYHVYPDMEFFEVVDKEGKRVPEGQPGEIVYTSLDWRGTVVLRYRTGDMTQGIEYDACRSCGKTVPRILPDIQRSSEIKEFHLTKIKGELVNMNQFFPLLSGMTTIEEWQLEIRKKDNDPHGLDELILYIAPSAGADFNTVKQEVVRRIHNDVMISVDVVEKPLQDILDRIGMETELKEKRIIDNRSKE